jgi:transcriptional regulator with XRE-family HTH domain
VTKLRNKIPSLLGKKEARDNMRYKQIEIANETGLSQSLISRTMRSKTLDKLWLSEANILANWLGCSLYDLFEIADEGSFSPSDEPEG